MADLENWMALYNNKLKKGSSDFISQTLTENLFIGLLSCITEPVVITV